MAQINLHRLAGQQVHGDGIAGEGVHRQHIELLIGFAFKTQAPVAENHFNFRRRIVHEREFPPRNIDDLRIDFVEAEHVALAPVGNDRTGPQANDADFARRFRQTGKHAAVTAGDAEITAWVQAVLRIHQLTAVHDATVHKRTERRWLRVITHLNYTIKITHHQTRIRELVLNGFA